MQQQIKAQKKEQYKETELGLLPESWEVVFVNDLFNVQQGKQLSAKESKEGKIEKHFLRTSNIFWEGIDIMNVSKMFFTKEEFEKLKLKTGDILVCEGGDIGRTALYSGELDECAYQNHLHRLRTKNENDSQQFFVFWMNYAINQRKMYIQEGNRTTIPNLSSSRLKNFKIPRPPFEEQYKITSVLSTIQTAQEKTEAVITALKELKKATMKHLFTYGLIRFEESNNVKLKETEIGQIPEDWDVVKIANVAKFQGGYAFKSKEYISDGVRLFKISNVSFGQVLWDDISYLPKDYLVEYKEFSLNPGEVIMAMTRPIVAGGIKVTRLTEDDCPSLLNQRVGRFILKSNIDPEFLFQLLFNRSFVEAIGLGAIGSQQPNISAGQIENIFIPLPPLEIQKQIASILATLDEKIDVEETKKNSLDELFKSMLHNLMAAKIRVNELVIPNEKN